MKHLTEKIQFGVFYTALAIILLSFLVFYLAGCVPIALYNYATHSVECEAIQADRDRGVVDSTSWQAKCAQPTTK